MLCLFFCFILYYSSALEFIIERHISIEHYYYFMAGDEQYNNDDSDVYRQQKSRHPKSKDTTKEKQLPQKDTAKGNKRGKRKFGIKYLC